MRDGGLSKCERAEGVILDGGKGILLHQWNVFEGCGVEDDLRLMLLKQVRERGLIGDAGETCDVAVRSSFAETAIYLVEGVF